MSFDGITFRPYQISAIDDIRNLLRQGVKRIVLQLLPGAGKTLTAAEIIRCAVAKGSTVLFIADRRALVDQTYRVFTGLGLDCSVVMADDARYAPWKKVQICSAQSLMRRKVPDADLVIVDEAAVHYDYLSGLMKTWSLVPFIGLDGLPLTRGLGNHYQAVVQGPDARELIELGTLVKPICYGPATIDTKGLKMKGNDFDQRQLDKRVTGDEITGDIVKHYLALANGRKTIMIPQNVAFSKKLVNDFNSSGVPFAHIDAHTPDDERQTYYRQLNTGELMGISSVGCLTRGFDEKSVSCIILAFVTRSPMKYIQAVWRAGRGDPDNEKKDFIVIDHGGNCERLGFPDDEFFTELCNGDETEAAKTTKELDKKKEKDLLPKKCPDCHSMVEGKVFSCKCGHLFGKRSEIEITQGNLKELTRSPAQDRHKADTRDEHQAMWSSFLKLGKSKGHSSHLYRDYYGVWKKGLNDTTDHCTSESMIRASKFKTAKQIAWAKR